MEFSDDDFLEIDVPLLGTEWHDHELGDPYTPICCISPNSLTIYYRNAMMIRWNSVPTSWPK